MIHSSDTYGTPSADTFPRSAEASFAVGSNEIFLLGTCDRAEMHRGSAQIQPE